LNLHTPHRIEYPKQSLRDSAQVKHSIQCPVGAIQQPVTG
jgi:hypothetical protein